MESSKKDKTFAPDNWDEMRALAHRSVQEDLDLPTREVVRIGDEAMAKH